MAIKGRGTIKSVYEDNDFQHLRPWRKAKGEGGARVDTKRGGAIIILQETKKKCYIRNYVTLYGVTLK